MLRFTAIALFALTGCAPTSETPAVVPPVSPPPAGSSTNLPPPPSDSGLDGTAWTLATIGEEPAPALATLAFTDSTMNGMGGCNRFFGPYTAQQGGVAGPLFSAGPLAGTKMQCGPIQPFEDRYLEALQGVRRWLVDADTLRLFGAGHLLVFARATGD